MSLLSKILLIISIVALGGLVYLFVQHKELQTASTTEIGVAKKNIESERKRADENFAKLSEALKELETLRKDTSEKSGQISSLTDRLQVAEANYKSAKESLNSAQKAQLASQEALNKLQGDYKGLEGNLFTKEEEIRKMREQMFVRPLRSDKPASGNTMVIQ